MIRRVAAGLLLLAAPALAQPPGAPPGGPENVARGTTYTLFPAPNYPYCTDPDDRVQLTDGQSTAGYFWTQPGTVGWTHARYATITLDLGQVEPIGGAALTTAAGAAGVTWPLAIHVLVSDDGKSFRDAGDLVALDLKAHGPWPEKYAIRRLWTTELRTRGRYVQLVLIPLPGGPYLFVDEVEVLRGPAELLRRDLTGQPVTDAKTLFEQGRIQRAVTHRWQADAAGLRSLISSSRLPDDARQQLLARLEEVVQQQAAAKVSADASFRAVLPIGEGHARLLAIQAQLWRRLGRPAFHGWVVPPWDPLELITVPPENPTGPVEVHMMRGEYREAAVNLANSTDRPLNVRLRFEGLPQSPTPGYVTVHEVTWTDTSQGVPVAAALPEAARTDGAWSVTVLPGLIQQVWLTLHGTDLASGEYAGSLIAQPEGYAALAMPIRLRVWPFDFPEKTTLWLGGWCYTNGNGAYGVTPKNRRQFLEHVQTRFVNAPWASGSVMMDFRIAEGDPPRVTLNTEVFDDWIGQWPRAGRYMVFLAQGHTFAGATVGTPAFDRRVGAWISAWVRHLGTKGIAPDRLALLIHDEPHEQTDVAPIVAWAKAIRAAEPKVLIWEDPTYRDPAKAPAELFEVCHVLCPNRPMWLAGGKSFAEFYLDQQRRGRVLEFYSCSGPARLLDPYSYYRLQAWHCWQVGATGSFFWALGDNSGASSWNEYLATAGPYTPLFIEDQSIVAGKQMEAIRQSAEDFEYFVMLRKAVDRAKTAGRADASVAKAEALLATGAADVLGAAGANQLRWHDPKDRTKADAVRLEILKALEALE